MINEDWLSCRLTVAPEDAELAADWLRDQGCEGVQIEDLTIVFDQSEDAILTPRSETIVTGYRRGDAPFSVPNFAAQIEVSPIETKNWAEEWRENFPPLDIGRFLVVPTWEVTPQTEKIVLKLDPGLAFGTGQHPTTHLCLELLGEVLEGQSAPRLLDIGCGSGILSLAAAKLGARVTASDLDPWCVQATQENAVLNDVSIEVREEADLKWVKQPFPFVIANLMSALLIRLAPELARVTQDGGVLVVSGISAPRADDVEAALTQSGFATLQKRELNGEARGEGEEKWVERWTAFVFEKHD